MQKLERLEDQSWSASANRLVNLDTLPARQRIRSIMLYLNLTGTKGAADALSADNFARAIKNIRLGPHLNIAGLDLYRLNQQIMGRTVMRGVDIPASGTAFSVNLAMEIPFRDTRQPGSDDGALPTELVVGSAIEVTFDTATPFTPSTIVITGGTLRSSAEMVQETNTPQLNRIGYFDPNSQTAQLDPGIYKDLMLVKADGSTISLSEVVAIDLDVDGVPAYNNALHEQIVHLYNRSSTEQAGANAEQTPGSATFLPLVFHDHSGKANLTKQPLVRNKGRLQISGSLTNYRLVYWKALPKTAEMIRDIASKIGAPDGAKSYEPAYSKVSPGKADRVKQAGRIDKKVEAEYAYLPGKLRADSSATSDAVADAVAE